jgi:glutamyl-tRNA synthetase
MTVRVRIAPAPSGSLHIGNARTALYNWLFARKHAGVFVLRVEDTDPSRVFEEHYQTIQNDLRWLGLGWDEGPGVGGPYGPYLQTERLQLYGDAAKKLIEGGHAYRCYCTPEELKARREQARAEGRTPRYDRRCHRLPDEERARFESEGRPWAVRLLAPDEGMVEYEDVVLGKVSFENADLDDVVLVRSDGRPLYNLAASVDDGLMEISHVIRGLDLQSATPYQILIHQRLGNAIPTYAHIPLVFGPGGKKFAKRFGGESVETFRSLGYLSDALINYLALLGWGTADQTILSRDGLVAKFELEKVHASPANIDPDRLDWMNGEYLRMLGDEELAEMLVPWLAGAGLVSDPPSDEEHARIAAIAPLVKTRIVRLDQAADYALPVLGEPRIDERDFDQIMRQPHVATQLEKSIALLQGLSGWRRDAIEEALRRVQIEMELKPKTAFAPFYVAITGSRVGLPIFDSMEIIGREKCLERLQRAREQLG